LKEYVARFTADYFVIAEAARGDGFDLVGEVARRLELRRKQRSLGLPKVPTVESENIDGQQSVRGGVRHYRIAHAATANQHKRVERTG